MKGMLGLSLVSLGLFVAILGGFLLNAETVTTCSTEWDYVTNVAGAFDGEKSDLYVDYNPSSNVTGWSTSPGFNDGLLSGVNYLPSSPNTYFIVTDAPAPVPDTITITAGQSFYSASSTSEGTFMTDAHSTEIWHIRVPGTLYNDARVLEIPLQAVMVAYGYEDYQLIEISMDPSYPDSWPGVFFAADMQYHYATSQHSGYYEWTGSPVTSMTIYPLAGTVRIGSDTYSISEVVLGAVSSNTLTMGLSTTARTATVYMDPAAGVIPDYDVSAYWCNNYENEAMTAVFSRTNFDGAAAEGDMLMQIISYDGASSTLMGVSVTGGRWRVEQYSGSIDDPILGIEDYRDIGSWPAIQITVSKGVLTVVPVSRFVSFGDYDVVNVPTTVEWDVAGGKTIGSFRIQPNGSASSVVRLSVTDTTVRIAQGGLYVQNGEMTPSDAFPNVDAVSLRIGSAAHVGTGIVFMDGARSVLIPVSQDGRMYLDGAWHPFGEVTFMWVSSDMPTQTIADTAYPAAVYIKGKTYAPDTIWAQFGTRMVEVMEADDWTILLEGVWAPSVQLYTGENAASERTELMDFTHGVFRWDATDFILVMMGVSVAGGLCLSYFGRMDLVDWALVIGAVAVLWLIL